MSATFLSTIGTLTVACKTGLGACMTAQKKAGGIARPPAPPPTHPMGGSQFLLVLEKKTI